MSVYAILGKSGNTDELGEISLYAAQQIGLNNASAPSVEAGSAISLTIYPGSGFRNGTSVTQDAINAKGVDAAIIFMLNNKKK